MAKSLRILNDELQYEVSEQKKLIDIYKDTILKQESQIKTVEEINKTLKYDSNILSREVQISKSEIDNYKKLLQTVTDSNVVKDKEISELKKIVTSLNDSGMVLGGRFSDVSSALAKMVLESKFNHKS